MTETRNVYTPMPSSVAELGRLASHLEDIRRANVAHNQELIAAAAGMGAHIIGLGELFPAPYFASHQDEFWKGMAEEIGHSKTIQELQETAREHNIAIVAPIYERDGDDLYNTAVVLDTNGDNLGRYRKCHIPRGHNEFGPFDERFYYGPSKGNLGNAEAARGAHDLLPVFPTAVVRVGVSICYDRHFEGMVSGLARGCAQLVFCPAVTSGSKSQRLWEREFEVDAARHHVFVGGSNRRGKEAPWNHEYYGRSYFVGPNGRCDNISTHPNLVVSRLDLGELADRDPSGWNLLYDRHAGL
jgi:N-carbamoylputrescine amidase